MLQIYTFFLICKPNHHFFLCPIENSMRLSSAMQAPSCGWLPKVGIFAHLPGCLSRQTLPRQTLPRPLPVSEGSSMLQFLRVITPLHHREGHGGGSECQPKIRPTCFHPCRLHLADDWLQFVTVSFPSSFKRCFSLFQYFRAVSASLLSVSTPHTSTIEKYHTVPGTV